MGGKRSYGDAVMAIRQAYVVDNLGAEDLVVHAQYWPISVDGYGDEYLYLNSPCRKAFIATYPETPAPAVSTPAIGNQKVQILP